MGWRVRFLLDKIFAFKEGQSKTAAEWGGVFNGGRGFVQQLEAQAEPRRFWLFSYYLWGEGCLWRGKKESPISRKQASRTAWLRRCAGFAAGHGAPVSAAGQFYGAIRAARSGQAKEGDILIAHTTRRVGGNPGT